MSMRREDRPLEILSVEDSIADQILIAEMLRNSTKQINVSFVSDGEKAICFLRRKGAYAEAPRPDLILLDLNIPKKNGEEVLREIRSDETFHRVPVLIFTTSRF